MFKGLIVRNKISVVVCTYNGEEFIEEQLSSILNQSRQPDEIIIGDDGSSDQTLVIVRKLLEQSAIPYKVIENKSSLGVTKNFENGMAHCSGDLIFTADQDDYWALNKVAIIEERMMQYPQCLLVFTNAAIVDHHRDSLGYTAWDQFLFNQRMLESQSYYEILLNRCIVTGATMAIRRELFEKSMPFPANWLHDGWLALNASIDGRMQAIDEELIDYRQHLSNVVGAKQTTFSKRVSKFFSASNMLRATREQEYQRYSAALERFSEQGISQDDQELMTKCVHYWQEMVQLNSAHFLKRIKIIFNHFFKGNYVRFNRGNKSFLKDLLVLFN